MQKCSILLVICLSCSIFDDHSGVETRLNLDLLSGDWFQIDTGIDTKFLKPTDVDTSQYTYILSFSFQENNNCSMLRIKPAYNRYSNCEYRVYGNENDVFLQINYVEMFQQWPINKGQLYRINDISDSFIKVTYLGEFDN